MIVAGPMKGFEGKVARLGRQLKLIVEVEFIRCGVSVEIESRMVQPVPAREPVTT